MDLGLSASAAFLERMEPLFHNTELSQVLTFVPDASLVPATE